MDFVVINEIDIEVVVRLNNYVNVFSDLKEALCSLTFYSD